MERKEYDNVIFYVGPEVEQTPAFSLKTLFVQGVRSAAKILEYAEKHNCKHVKIGANNSFQRNKLLAGVVTEILQAGVKVSLVYPVDAHEFVLETYNDDILGHPNFIPVVTCQIRRLESISKNMSVKIDDAEFGGSNAGVWTFVTHNLLDPNRKTDWNDYSHEEVLLTDEEHKKVTPKAAEPKPKKVVEEKVVEPEPAPTVEVEKPKAKAKPRAKKKPAKSKETTSTTSEDT